MSGVQVKGAVGVSGGVGVSGVEWGAYGDWAVGVSGGVGVGGGDWGLGACGEGERGRLETWGI